MVGVILVLALLVTALVMIRTQWVPVWEADDEAAHSLAAADRIAALGDEIRRSAGNGSGGERGVTLLLGETTSSLFKPPTLASELSFVPKVANVSAVAPDALLLESNGTLQTAVENQWRPFPGVVTFTDVDGIADLRLRVAEVSAAKDNRAVTVSLTHRLDGYQGGYRLRVALASGELHIHRETFNDRHELAYSTFTSMNSSNVLRPYFDDVLDARNLFDRVLASAERPLDVTIAYDPGFDTDYATAYYIGGSGGGKSVLVATSGRSAAPLVREAASGVLMFRSNNLFYPAQTVVVEHGAVVLQQLDGASFRIRPSFSARVVGNTTVLDWQLPVLDGEANALHGGGTATAHTIPVQSSRFVATSASLNITLATAYPAIWAAHFEGELRRAGLSPDGATPQFEVATGPGVVTLRVWGLDAQPSSPTHDITWIHAESVILTRIKP